MKRKQAKKTAAITLLSLVVLGVLAYFGPAQAQQHLGATIATNGGNSWVPFGRDYARTNSYSEKGSKISTMKKTRSTSRELSMNLSLPGMTVIDTLMEDGQMYSSIVVPGAGKFEVGKPDVPVFGRFIVIPNGTSVAVEVYTGEPIIFDEIDVPPLQPDEPDFQGAGKAPFAKNHIVYSKNADFPGVFVTVDPIKSIRGQDCTIVWFYPYQYNPVRRQLSVYKDLSVTLHFDGEIQPVPKRLKSKQFEAMFKRLAVNTDEVLPEQSMKAEKLDSIETNIEIYEPASNGVNGGCKYLIICDPAFQTAADTLAAWKRLTGFSTKVVTTTTTGSTAAAIETYIDNSQSWSPAPEYVLLLGDSEYIPCFYVLTHAGDADKIAGTLNGLLQHEIATDRYYGDTNGDECADLFVGRLPVDSLTEAQTAVDRIIDYERTPPDSITEASFYDEPTVGAYFQDDNYDGYADRRFAKTSEDIYDFLTNSAGYSAQRIYFTQNDRDPNNWSTIARYIFENDTSGAALPAYLLKPAFPWDGDTADITAAINNGTFLLTHRDHGSRILRYPSEALGWSGGWDHPGYLPGDVDALTNGELVPVVWSINCQTGWFDNETDDPNYEYMVGGAVQHQFHTNLGDETLCERFIYNSNGGAVGVIGATRISYSGKNDRLAWGWMDAIWPNFIEYHSGTYGGSEPIYQMGPVFEYGRDYMLTHYTYSTDDVAQTAIEEFHWFGDPTMEIWTDAPVDLTVAHPGSVEVAQPNNVTVTVKIDSSNLEGARVTISRAATPDDYWTGLTDASGNITFNGLTTSVVGDYNIVVTAHNCLPYEGIIASVDTTPPEVVVLIPIAGSAVQDGITLTAQATDFSDIVSAAFTIREVNSADPNGTPVGFENMPATYNGVTGKWECFFDSTLLPDGYYQIFATATDEYGNVGTSDVVLFSIRNWAVVVLLPSSKEYRAGRTMPIKFSLRISEAVDPAMPFVYNEQLRIDIYKTSDPGTILQSSLFGNSSTDYRIDTAGELYITNFKTSKKPTEYTVDIWRFVNDFLIDSFTFDTMPSHGKK